MSDDTIVIDDRWEVRGLEGVIHRLARLASTAVYISAAELHGNETGEWLRHDLDVEADDEGLEDPAPDPDDAEDPDDTGDPDDAGDPGDAPEGAAPDANEPDPWARVVHRALRWLRELATACAQSGGRGMRVRVYSAKATRVLHSATILIADRRALPIGAAGGGPALRVEVPPAPESVSPTLFAPAGEAPMDGLSPEMVTARSASMLIAMSQDAMTAFVKTLQHGYANLIALQSAANSAAYEHLAKVIDSNVQNQAKLGELVATSQQAGADAMHRRAVMERGLQTFDNLANAGLSAWGGVPAELKDVLQIVRGDPKLLKSLQDPKVAAWLQDPAQRAELATLLQSAGAVHEAEQAKAKAAQGAQGTGKAAQGDGKSTKSEPPPQAEPKAEERA